MEILNIRYNIHNYKNEDLNSFDDLFNFYIQALSKYRDNDIYRGLQVLDHIEMILIFHQ